jgi:hypothetical protein
MSFGRFKYGKEERFITIVLDADGRELAKWNSSKKDYPNSIRILIRQFGLNIKVIDKDNNINKERKDEDLDWALK